MPSVADEMMHMQSDNLIRILKGLRDEQNSVQESIEALRSGLAEQTARINSWNGRVAADRRDTFVKAVLTGLCSTPLAAQAAADPVGPSKLAMLAMSIADATIDMLDRLGPPDSEEVER